MFIANLQIHLPGTLFFAHTVLLMYKIKWVYSLNETHYYHDTCRLVDGYV